MWVYSQGFWLLPHYTYDPVNNIVDEDRVILWLGDPTTVDTFDGGEAGPVTAISGPMWSILTSMAARMPIAPGTLPSGTVLAVGNTGGEEKHALTTTELPEHTHFMAANENQDTNPLTSTNQVAVSGAAGNDEYGLKGSDLDATLGNTSPVGSPSADAALPHQNMPPFFCINFLRKTSRSWYRLPP
ncbi:MAG TPA: hypothetical protein VFQ43_08725 [Nitrososphaera sp.]|nr:hypothetical protein [Nitrososphaera sp.]